jgi:hypothetical protein
MRELFSDFTGATSEIGCLGREHREGKRFWPVQGDGVVAVNFEVLPSNCAVTVDVTRELLLSCLFRELRSGQGTSRRPIYPGDPRS